MSLGIDDERLEAAVHDAAAAAFREVRERRPEERFYAFGLWVPADRLDLLPTCNTEEALRGATEGARWRPRAWGRHRVGEGHFGGVRELLRALPQGDRGAPARRARVLEACARALRSLDAGGFFGQGAERDRVIIAVFTARLEPEELLASARRLNPPAACERLARELGVRDGRGQAIGVLGEGERTYAAHALSQAEDGTVAAVVDDAVVGWGWPEGEERLRRPLPRAWAVALSPSGEHLVVGEGPGGVLRRYRLDDGVELPILPGPPLGVSALAFGPGADARPDEVIVAGVDEELWAIDAARGQLRASRRLAAHGLAVGHDRIVAATGGRVLLLDRATLASRAALGRRSDELRCVAMSPDGDLLAAGGRSGDRGLLALFDAASGAERLRLELPDEVTCTAVSRDGRLVAAGDLQGEARVWDVASSEPLGLVRGAHQLLTWVAFSPDGGTLLTAGRDVGRGPPVTLWRVGALAPMLSS